MADSRLLDFLISLKIPASEAEPVTELTQLPEEALQLLGRGSDGTITLPRKDISEWYSEQHQKYFYAIKGQSTTSWNPPPSFCYSEWHLDSQLYGISLKAARDIYIALDSLLTRHEPAVSWPALTTISKIVTNIASCGNSVEKYRSVRLSNEKFNKKVSQVPGAIDVLLLAGFKILGDSVVFPENASLVMLQATASRAERLAQLKGHSGDAKPDGTGKGNGAQRSDSKPPSQFYGTPGFQYQERIYHCSVCDHPVNDGSERLWTGRFDAPHGEYRYECTTCVPPNAAAFNFCQQCWDRFQAGEPLHDRAHSFQHIGPRLSRHNDYYGTQSSAGGEISGSNPWGNRSLGAGYGRALERLHDRYGMPPS